MTKAFSKQEKVIMWSSVVLGVAWILYRIFNSTGWILDDEICHYTFSRSVWENSDQVFNHWTRPGRNLLHCLVAPLGFTATRVYTLLLALLALVITFKVGKLLQLRALWAVPMMLLFQSWFPELSYPVLTQTPFMLFWVLGVWLGLTGRWHLAGFCFGYLSLIRHEGILLTGIWGLWVTFGEGGFGRHLFEVLRSKLRFAGLGRALGRDLLYGVSTISAIVLYNVAAFVFNDTFPFSVYFETKPTEMYGSGTLYHYVPLLIGGVGVVSSILAVIGIYSLRSQWRSWSLLLATYPVYFLLHSLIYWKGAFASGGYYHFIMPMAPFVALLCAEAIGRLLENGGVQKRVAYAALGLVVFQGVNMAQHQLFYQDWEAIHRGEAEVKFGLVAGPMEKGKLSQAVVDASHWAVKNYPEDTTIIAKHVAHVFTQGQLSTREQLAKEYMALHEMAVGTVYIWDHLYSQQENRVRYSSFAESDDWCEVKRWGNKPSASDTDPIEDQCSVIIFEKISLGDTFDKQYEELGEAEKVDKLYE